MNQQLELENCREEVRREIFALKERIPSALILKTFGKAFKKGGFKYWTSNFVSLNILLLGPWVIFGFLLNESSATKPVIIPSVIAVEDVILALILGHLIIRNMLDNLACRITERITKTDDLLRLLSWLKKTWSSRSVSIFSLVISFLWIALGIESLSLAAGNFIGIGLSLTVVLVGLLAGLGFYFPFWMSILASTLKEYQYDMNAFTPSQSEIIKDISAMMDRGIYILSAYCAIITLLSTSPLIPLSIKLSFSFPFAVIAWTIIIVQFLLTRATLKVITEKAKWKTLNRLQIKINFIEAMEDLSDRETAEKLLSLADIHRQIVKSKIHTFDWKSFSILLSQLLLPLLALLLANLDNVSAFLH